VYALYTQTLVVKPPDNAVEPPLTSTQKLLKTPCRSQPGGDGPDLPLTGNKVVQQGISEILGLPTRESPLKSLINVVLVLYQS
jgi:hypothetical protein